MLNTVSNNKDIIPSVFSTSADRSIGIEQLYNGINEYLTMVKDRNLFNERQLDRYRNRVLSLIKDKLISEFWTDGKINKLDKATNNIKSTKTSPYKLAEELLAQ